MAKREWRVAVAGVPYTVQLIHSGWIPGRFRILVNGTVVFKAWHLGSPMEGKYPVQLGSETWHVYVDSWTAMIPSYYYCLTREPLGSFSSYDDPVFTWSQFRWQSILGLVSLVAGPIFLWSEAAIPRVLILGFTFFGLLWLRYAVLMYLSARSGKVPFKKYVIEQARKLDVEGNWFLSTSLISNSRRTFWQSLFLLGCGGLVFNASPWLADPFVSRHALKVAAGVMAVLGGMGLVASWRMREGEAKTSPPKGPRSQRSKVGLSRNLLIYKSSASILKSLDEACAIDALIPAPRALSMQ